MKKLYPWLLGYFGDLLVLEIKILDDDLFFTCIKSHIETTVGQILVDNAHNEIATLLL